MVVGGRGRAVGYLRFQLAAPAQAGTRFVLRLYPLTSSRRGLILRRSVVPSGLPAWDLARARDIAGTIAAALDYVGVLAVEMFYLGADAAPAERLMVNEIAPRVHNSGLTTANPINDQSDVYPHTVVLADLNRDGCLDAIVVGRGAPNPDPGP